MPTTFIGLDLAWQSDKNHSGAVVLRGDQRGAELVDVATGLMSVSAVVEYVLAYATPTELGQAANTVVAIDAPLIITNPTGQRACERECAQRFGRYHAGAHPVNLTRFPDAGSLRVVRALEAHGFTHTPEAAQARRHKGRWFCEVYPHPAQVVFFGLDRIIQYKKGRLADKRAGLDVLRGYIQRKFLRADPPLNANPRLRTLLRRDTAALTGRALKHYEDTLDALVCAYIALFYWAWGAERAALLGNLQTGYIVVPTAPL